MPDTRKSSCSLLVAALTASLAAACAGSAPEPAASSVRPVAPPSSAGDDTASAPAAAAPDSQTALDDAIRTAVGGMFAVDHLGPARHAEIVRQLRASPDRTLDAFERLYLGPGAAPDALDDHYLAVVLDLVWSRSPERVALIAARLLTRIQQAQQVVLPPDVSARLDAGRRSLQRFTLGLDVPAQPGASPVEPTRLCLDQAPGAEATLLWLERDCTCGEPLSCTTEPHGAAVDVRFVQNPGPGICDDCYASGTTCTLPALAAASPVRLRVNGRVVLETTTDARGLLPPSGCRAAATP